MTKLSVLGVGRVGSAIARAAVAAGYDVAVAASGPAADIALLTEVVIPGAKAMDAAEASRHGDIVVVAVPLHKHRNVEPGSLGGKVVVDVMNYWPPVDGELDQFEDDPRSTSEVVADHFAGARLVKAFNHIGYHELEEHRLPKGSPRRRALAVASDHPSAAAAVADLVDRIGFDVVHSGPLATGVAFEPGTRIFNGAFTADELSELLGAQAQRLAG